MQMRHSKAMRAPRRHVRREVGIGMRLPADHDEIAGEVAEQDVVLEKALIRAEKKGAISTQRGKGRKVVQMPKKSQSRSSREEKNQRHSASEK